MNIAAKPAKRPLAHSVSHPSGDGYAGEFALPGLVPRLLVDQTTGQTTRFATSEAARNASLSALFTAMTHRVSDRRKACGYIRLTGSELAVLLREADVTPTEFAELYGVPQHRVMGWLDGVQDIPHSANVLVRLLAIEENYQEAKSLTRQLKEKETS